MTGSERAIEAEVQRDFSRSMSYGDYLALDQLLTAQHPRSEPPQHDELLFIIQHQTSELWLKLMLHELRSARSLLASDELSPALKRMARVERILEVLTEQWSVLATLTPSEYAQIRPFLATSSGFQSWQYRAVEFLLGNKNADMVRVFDHDPAAHSVLDELLHEPTLYDEFLRYLGRHGYPVPQHLLERDVTRGIRVGRAAGPGLRGRIRGARRALGRLRDVRGAGRSRGQRPALAVPAPPRGHPHHRPEAGHRRVERRGLPAAGAGPHVLP